MKSDRELTRSERRDVRKLIKSACANYDSHYQICLIAGRTCLMLTDTISTGHICTYFKNAVLPTNPALEASLTRNPVETKPCAICGNQFVPSGRQVYCSEFCENQGNRIKSRARMQKKRERAGVNVTICD